MKAFITRKVGMTSTIASDGTVAAVTLLSASDNVVTQLKNSEIDGYLAVQIGFEEEKHVSKPLAGHLKASSKNAKVIREIRVSELPEELKHAADKFMEADDKYASAKTKKMRKEQPKISQDEAQALIHDPIEAHALGFKISGDLRGSLVAADLLVVSIAKVDRSLRLITSSKQALGSFQLADDQALDIKCTTTPDIAIGNVSREWPMRPTSTVLRFHWHHILVCIVHHRRLQAVFAQPAKQERVPTDHLTIHVGMH